MSTLSRSDLEAAAINVIHIIKGIPEFADARVAVIGGLALWKYMPNGRTTDDVDFIINIDSAPASVKNKLLALPKSPFLQQAQFFFYKTSDGKNIQIDITPGWQSPYMPPAAVKLCEIPDGTVPYISVIDLIVFKINSCGMRAQDSKKRKDAKDAATLLGEEAKDVALTLTEEQKEIVEPCIADVVAHSGQSDKWWRTHLGLASAS